MIDFTLTSDGVNATSTYSVIINRIALYDSNGLPIGNEITDFSGNVVKDELGIEDNVVLDFAITLPDEDTAITSIKLKSDTTIIAESETIYIVKPANKRLRLRITARVYTPELPHENRSARFKFNCISVGLPYATTFRQGVVKLAHPTNESYPQYTVYTAADTIAKISDYIHTDTEHIPWDVVADTVVRGSFTASNINLIDDYATSTYGPYSISADKNGFVFSTQITGPNAVTSTPNFGSTTVATSSLSYDTKLTTTTYISALYSNSIDTAPTETADSRKLVTSHAVRSYVESKDSLVVHISNSESINGTKTFTGGIVADSPITGTGIYSSYSSGSDVGGWDNSSSNAKIPTVQSVRSAISDIETSVKNSIQTQIDAINAGQNLADIVNSKSDLISLSTSALKAKGEYKKGSSGSTWAVGDKVQVLHDKTKQDGAQDSTAGYQGIPTVYELVKGTATPNTQDAQSTDNSNYFWDYIGEYGTDSYSKSDADSTFIKQSSIATSYTIGTHLSSENYVPSVKATESQYVKLNSSAVSQTIVSPIKLYNRSNDASYMTIISQDDSLGGALSNITSYSKNTKFTLASRHYDALAVNSVTKIILDGQGNTDESGPGLGNFSVCGESHGTDVKMLSLEQTSSKHDTNGTYVASYRDIDGATLSDGRLVTVDYLTGITGNTSAYAKKSDSNTFASGYTNTFEGAAVFNGSTTISGTTTLNGSITGDSVYSTYTLNTWNTSYTSGDLLTVSAANDFVANKVLNLSDDILIHVSDINSVGSIGLFIYSEHDSSGADTSGNEKGYGSEINGEYLKAVGMSLPMSGQISYKSAALVPSCSGTWKLLSLAVKRTSTEPCIVMAQKIHNTYPKPTA